ncbi:hypothetical protein [Cupriavidus consociatus]|uniref:hypothetical protein n=1 Tax=Cupriavidus consociatus TaxID=2821357 RepID=UPI001AE74DD2|nr:MULTISPECIES: hypothetical protein [unclassified Cupriavidus]MBP0620892.1 hypothetical protein [Cupriavidus sp. LEh25]MDK2657557.1 hypothetical protein [Cupriavidus sp. LEh21]
MDLRSLVLVLSSALLALTSFVYGWKFMKSRNYLLGVELWIVGISSTNAIGFFSTGSEVLYEISHFFDAFSRGFGIPIISILGLMAVTHGYKPSIRQDVVVFLASFAGAFVLVGTSFMGGALPYYYLVMWTLMSLYLLYFIKRLLGVGATFQAMALLVALIASQAIACINDFYKIPGEETNVVFNFFTLALCTWAYFSAAIYYAYSALERSKNEGAAFGEPTPYRI